MVKQCARVCPGNNKKTIKELAKPTKNYQNNQI